MKNLSVKTRIAVWLTVLMVLLSGTLLIFMLSISSSVARETAMEQLGSTVRANLEKISVAENGTVSPASDFLYYSNGVSSLVYSKNETLLAGQLPIDFTGTREPFQNGVIRTVSASNESYLVLDLWLADSWDSGVWVRGVIQETDHGDTAENLLKVALIALPLFILLAAAGSYHIARRAFKPLDRITATAEAINEARDLSGRIALPPANNEFSRLADTFDGMFERLERSFEAEKQFTADASHELRTPVSIIKSACEYSEKYDPEGAEHAETVAMIHRQADKMAELISQLLSITRLDQGIDSSRLRNTDLGTLVLSVCGEINVPDRLHVSVQENFTAVIDPDLISRLIRNLVENGFKHGKPDGNVWVTLTRGNNEFLLSVRDDGSGIPEEHREKIWQRFYQADPARSGDGGAGLGLAMVRQIALAHGGYMSLESKPGNGSTFTLHLPEFR